MKQRCHQLKVVEDWARQGCHAELPASLRSHALQCDECRKLLDEVHQSRGIFSDWPEVSLTPARVDAIRFVIMAAARRGKPGRDGSGERPSRLIRRSVAAVALLVTALVSATWLSDFGRTVDLPCTVAEVRLQPEAEGEQLRPGPDEIYALREGTAEFVVSQLGEGQRFRVISGTDTVEVSGTRFQVEASRDRLMRVAVSEGRVLVSVDSRLAAILRAGETWTRDRPAQKTARSERPAPRSGPQSAQAVAEASRVGRQDTHAREVGEHQRHPPVRATGHSEASRNGKPPSGIHQDAVFRHAWRLLQAGRYREAARTFDALVQAPGLDPGRRADLLYWSAKAHELGGEWTAAQARASRLAQKSPNAWHAPHAALLLGESLLLQGDFFRARRWLGQALSSDRPGVRKRARELLRQLDEASGSK